MRHLWKNKLYTLINVTGLTLGVCSCLLIGSIVQYEFSFDRFHADGGRVYHLTTLVRDGSDNSAHAIPCVLPPMAEALRKQVPGLAAVAPYYLLTGAGVSTGKHSWPASATPVAVTTPDYFRIMPYDWLAGDKNTALSTPFSVVLTEKGAAHYFGSAAPSEFLGRELLYDSLHVHVTGIIKDWQGHTDFPYTEFISLSTAAHSWLKEQLNMEQWKVIPLESRCWVKLAPGADPGRVQAAITTLFNTH